MERLDRAGVCRSAALRALTVLAAALLGLSGCEDDAPAKAKPAQPTPAQTGDVVASKQPRVRAKGGARYATDLAAALALPRDQLCKELGTLDCVDDVHRIVLGGVEPYDLGIYQPLAVAPMTAPIAVDRVALSACARAARRDVQEPEQAVFWRDRTPGVALSAAERAAVARRIYDRVLRRDAEAFEVEALVGLHDDVVAELAAAQTTTTAAGDADEQWLTLACFAVASGTEALFY